MGLQPSKNPLFLEVFAGEAGKHLQKKKIWGGFACGSMLRPIASVEQPSGKLDPALWRLPASFPEVQANPI